MTVYDARLTAMLGPGAPAVCAAFDAMPQALGMLWPVRDERGAVVDFEVGYTNPSGDVMMGVAMGDELGTRVIQAMPALREMGVYDRLIRVAETGVAESVEIEMRGLWKGVHQVGGTYAHSALPFGEGVLSVSHDLTEERRQEAVLRDFAVVAAHDLRDPLVGLQVMVSALARSPAGNPDIEMVELMRDAIDRAQRLVGGLLDYATATAGMENREQVDCAFVVREVLLLLAGPIEAADARVDVHELPVVYANADGLGRVFQNLVANALKFRAAAPPEIVISAEAVDGAWHVAVRDNGIGLPDGELFEMFGRGAGETRDGSGIGLAVCRRIVEQHGGRIWGEAAPGGGSTLMFTLPGDEPPASALGV